MNLSDMSMFKNQTGTSLIEVLITVLVVGVGLLGIASTQNLSVKLSYDSYLRSQSALLANDLFDRARANPTIAYDNESATTTTDCTANDCNPITIMQYDITQWSSQVRQLFPEAVFTIDVDNADPTLYTISFRWESRTEDGTNDGANDDRVAFEYSTKITN